MGCRKLWNREHLNRALAKTFVDGPLKRRREQILFERELAMMPATQPLVERELSARAIEKALEQLRAQKRDLQRRLRDLSDDIYAQEGQLYRLRSGRGLTDGTERREFVRKCPATGCRGFLSRCWKCGICNAHVCKDCNEVCEDRPTHVCSDDAKESMQLINNDSRPCPSCGVLIQKLLGCDQMFCTHCKTAFSWRLGTIEQGAIHNPHYYELARQNPGVIAHRNFGDFPCGGLPAPRGSAQLPAWCSDALRRARHVENVDMPAYRVLNDTNERLRMRYMMNDISEATFKRDIQKAEKSRQKKRDIMDVYQMVHDTVAEFLREVFDIPSHNSAIQLSEADLTRLSAIHDGILMIQTYANDALKVISKRYSNCAVPVVHVINVG